MYRGFAVVHCPPGRERSVESDRVFRHVWHEDRERVAFGEPSLREARGERADGALQFGVAELAAGDAVDQGGLVSKRGRASERERGEVARGELVLDRAA